MSTQTLNRPLFSQSPVAAIAAFVVGFAKAFAFASDAEARFDAIQRLQGLSDAELAQRGIPRDGIVRHVYGDLLTR